MSIETHDRGRMSRNANAEASRSLWMDEPLPLSRESLSGDVEADVVIVGAGIAGLSAAYEFAVAGRSVVVLDRGAIGGGMTGRTTAHLASQFDDYYHEYLRLRGETEARTYYDSQQAAIERIEAIQREEAIDCDFARLDGYLVLAPGGDPAILERELVACRRVGFTDVAWAEAPAAGLRGPALRFPRQGRFHPLRYLAGLARAVEARGGRIFTHSPVAGVEERDGGVRVSAQSGFSARGQFAVVATNSPINDWVTIHTKQAPYRTYVIAAPVPAGAVPDALYWDTLDPYHYVRLQPGGDHDWLIVGGEDHKTGEADDFGARFARLEAWTRTHFPQAGAPAYGWSGQVMEPVDAVPFIGRNHGQSRVYVATGDSGEGVTTGAVAGMLLPALAMQGTHPWADAYRPQRASFRAAGEYLRENATMLSNLTEYVRGGDVGSLDQVRPGCGAVVRVGMKKIAAYRDPSGELHLRSAVCTHAGCIVHWNDFETCWDCPCHGSQFAPDGEPLHGPASSPLGKA